MLSNNQSINQSIIHRAIITVSTTSVPESSTVSVTIRCPYKVLVRFQFSFHNINTIIYRQFLYITRLAEKNKYSQTYLKGHLYIINYCL